LWSAANIPIQDKRRAISNILILYDTGEKVKKNTGRKSSPAQTARGKHFVGSLDDLFNIAHQDALSMIKIDEDREFLLAQREKGRRGTMQGKDIPFIKQPKAFKEDSG